MQVTHIGVTIECQGGDIAAQNGFEAVVNAANAWLKKGGGVAGALHRAAGPKLEEEGSKLAPIKPGQAVITAGYNLPNRFVIHCLGPVYGKDQPADQLLAACYQNALKLAEDNQVQSIAFPSISTGIFGYPMQEAALVAFKTIKETLPLLKKVKKIRFVLHGDEALKVHCRALQEVFSS